MAVAAPLAKLPIPNDEEAPHPPWHQAPLPPMKLDSFHTACNLSDAIKDKLVTIQIAGPHVLWLITDTDLQGEGGLSVGKLALVRDAQHRWNHYTMAVY